MAMLHLTLIANVINKALITTFSSRVDLVSLNQVFGFKVFASLFVVTLAYLNCVIVRRLGRNLTNPLSFF